MKPRVIVFDLGKVLVDFDWSIACRNLALRSRNPVDPVHFFTGHQAALLCRYELGELSTEQFFEEIREASDFAGTPEEFGEAFANIFTEIKAMTGIHATLRKMGFSTWIFSNTNELAVRHIRKSYPFFAGFDGYIYSYEHGAMKPDARLYEVIERETRRRGKEIVYIDDRPENAAAGAARDWHAIMHETPDKTRAALEKLGVLKPGVSTQA